MNTSIFGRARLFSGVLPAFLAAIALTAAGCGDNSTGPSGSLACKDGEAWVITKNEALAIPGIDVLLGMAGIMYPLYTVVINDVDAFGIVFKPDSSVMLAAEFKWTDAVVEAFIEASGMEIENAVQLELAKAVIFMMAGGKNTKGWFGATQTGAVWKQSRNDLIITDSDGHADTIPVSVSGNTLTITNEGAPPVTLKKESGLKIKQIDDLRKFQLMPPITPAAVVF